MRGVHVVNPYRALTNNPRCIGICWKLKNGKYDYQNDNDLGLDVDAYNTVVPVVRVIDCGDGYLCYQLRNQYRGVPDDTHGTGVTEATLVALLRECHNFPLSDSQKRLCNKYWNK